MPDENEPAPPGRGVSFALTLLLTLALLYFGSAGPVIWGWHKTYGFHGHISGKAIHTFYAPGIWLYEKTILQVPIAFYLKAWGAK